MQQAGGKRNKVSGEVMKVAMDRHQKGLMSPLIHQLLVNVGGTLFQWKVKVSLRTPIPKLALAFNPNPSSHNNVNFKIVHRFWQLLKLYFCGTE